MATPPKKILAIYTGGTIGMQETPGGLAPCKGFLATALNQLNLPAHDLLEYSPLIDSSAATPALWQHIAQDIETQYDHYSGFVVIHGTDTLSYTAAALALQLQNIRKPVIVTGAMQPIGTVDGDAESNLALAFYWASQANLGQVAVAFSDFLFSGARVRKLDAQGRHAFASPHLEPLTTGRLPLQPSSNMGHGHLHRIHFNPNLRVLAVKLYPGSLDWIAHALSLQPADALLLESYGSGNLPRHAPLESVVSQLIDSGKLVAQVSQCWKGLVSRTYAAGDHYAALGVLSAGNMTPEAALCKLFMAANMRTAMGQKWFITPQCGEMD